MASSAALSVPSLLRSGLSRAAARTSGSSTPAAPLAADGGAAAPSPSAATVTRSGIPGHNDGSVATATATDPPRTAREAGVPDMTDEALLEAVAAGDREAMRDLVERYRGELLNFLTRFLGSRAAGEDVFQEAFLQVWMSADTFDPTRRFKPWLFTIAANKARDHHRRHARRQFLSLSAQVGSGDGDDGAAFVDLMAGDDPDPGLPIATEERQDLVRGVVDELPPHLREILLLSYFQRMSYAQVAGTLGIPLGTVKSRLHAAVGAFAKAWQEAERREDATDDDDASDE